MFKLILPEGHSKFDDTHSRNFVEILAGLIVSPHIKVLAFFQIP